MLSWQIADVNNVSRPVHSDMQVKALWTMVWTLAAV